jgi:NodT family efflux transporter outer membrane factor (OMF) lipoprotein
MVSTTVEVVSLCLLLSLTACSNLAGPDYQRPDTPTKSQWSDKDKIGTVDEVIRPDWWKNFDNAVLDQLITTALTNNSDLAVLTARIGTAEASIDQANAARLPSIDAALGANLQTSEGTDSARQYSYATAVGWELDIWGKAKKGVEAQQAAYRASEAEWRAGYLELIANVAESYFQVSQFDEQIESQQTALENSEKILTIYRSLNAEGVIPKTRVLQQQAESNQLRNDLLELQRLRKLSVNALATLTGPPAGELQLPTQNLSDLPLIKVPAGLPSDLLSRRPDIIAAEYRVLQAHQLQGQARLAKLPSINLTSNLGNTSFALTSLLKSWAVGLASTASIPIFDPNVQARIKGSEAETRVAEEEYRSTVIKSFEEVENALVNLASHGEQRKELIARQEQLKIVSEQFQAQVREGMISQLELFESERSLLAAELARLSNHRQILVDTVVLYKVLGGGWPAVEVKPKS